MLFGLVRQAAARVPDQRLVIARDGELSYLACLRRSEQIGSALRERGIDRFGCLMNDPTQAVTALVGSSAVGSEACMYPRDAGPEQAAQLAVAFGHEFVITDSVDHLKRATAVPVASLCEPTRAPFDVADEWPVLILTTGTTGEPKGTRHDWCRLLRAFPKQAQEAGTRWLLAYNLNQFAGIQVLLQVLASGGTLVEPASRRAEDVIAAIETHAVTHVSATPTFWRLLVGRLDESTAGRLPLRQITLGGEAASQSLIERLHALFPQARLAHVYAGSEFGSVVSVKDGQSGLPLSVLDRPETAGVRFRIVAGELQVRSRVGMLGYHGTALDEGEWVRTGDLVQVTNERIHFVGRRSELINVGGAKVHPLPVEEAICSVPGVQLAAVYGRPNPVTGQIVVADVVPNAGASAEELKSRIRNACRALPAASRPRRIRVVPGLDIRGNKVLRHEVESSAAE